MKLIEIVRARDSLQKLVQQDLPIRKAYELMELTDLCNRHLGFYGQEIGKFDPEKNPERLDELDSLEVEDVVRVSVPITDDLMLSAADVKLLLPLIKFTEEE